MNDSFKPSKISLSNIFNFKRENTPESTILEWNIILNVLKCISSVNENYTILTNSKLWIKEPGKQGSKMFAFNFITVSSEVVSLSGRLELPVIINN